MKKMFMGMLFIVSLFSQAKASEIEACSVKLIFKEESAKVGLAYSYEPSRTGYIVVFGPKDKTRTCEDTESVIIKKLPIRISPTRGLGLTASYTPNFDKMVSIHRWDGNTLEELLGVYGGVRLGLGFLVGANGFGMVKMSTSSLVTLSSRAWANLGLQIDASLIEFKIKKITSEKIKDSAWSLVLRKHQ